MNHFLLGYETDTAVCGKQLPRHTPPTARPDTFMPMSERGIRTTPAAVADSIDCPVCHHFIELLRKGATVQAARREAKTKAVRA